MTIRTAPYISFDNGMVETLIQFSDTRFIGRILDKAKVRIFGILFSEYIVLEILAWLAYHDPALAMISEGLAEYIVPKTFF